jgi:hypothetical protein
MLLKILRWLRGPSACNSALPSRHDCQGRVYSRPPLNWRHLEPPCYHSTSFTLSSSHTYMLPPGVVWLVPLLTLCRLWYFVWCGVYFVFNLFDTMLKSFRFLSLLLIFSFFLKVTKVQDIGYRSIGFLSLYSIYWVSCMFLPLFGGLLGF